MTEKATLHAVRHLHHVDFATAQALWLLLASLAEEGDQDVGLGCEVVRMPFQELLLYLNWRPSDLSMALEELLQMAGGGEVTIQTPGVFILNTVCGGDHPDHDDVPGG